MKRVLLILALAGVMASACNKETTPPEQTEAMPEKPTMTAEEMQAIQDEKARVREEIEKREAYEAAWAEKKAKEEQQMKAEMANQDFVDAQVVDGSVLGNGCGWLLQLKTGKKLVPENLPPAYREQGKRVVIKYGAGTEESECSYGKPIKIYAIEFKK